MRGGRASWRLLVSLMLILGGLVAGIGLPAGALADTTYASCPNYATFQTAVQSAPANTTTTITFQVPCSYDTSTGVNGIDIPDNSTVVIDGDGLTITAGTATGPASSDIFDLENAASLRLDHTTLRFADNGIGYFGTGGDVTLTNSTIMGSQDEGIYASGNVVLTNSTVSDSGNDGIAAGGNVTLTNSTISNSGVITGAISGDNGIDAIGDVTLTNSEITGSSSDGVSSFGKVTLTNSTVAKSDSDGIAAAGALTGTNSTVSDSGGDGIAAGAVTLTNSTVSDSGGDGVFAFKNATLTFSTVVGSGSDGVFTNSGGITTLTATILADNSPNCAIHGTLIDEGYNLADDSSCGFSATGSQNNVSDAALELGPLGNYGGPTQTVPLEVGSIVIDTIPVNSSHECLDANNNVITDSSGAPITTDQRGVSQPQGAKCDVGAFEWSLPTSTPNTAVEIVTLGYPAIRAQIFVGGSGIPLGYVTYASTAVRFRFLLVERVVQTGPNQGTLYGTGVLTTGQAVTWQLDLHGNLPQTVQLRLSTGYDSGPLHVYGIVEIANTGQ